MRYSNRNPYAPFSLWSWLLIGVVVLGLVGCGSDEESLVLPVVDESGLTVAGLTLVNDQILPTDVTMSWDALPAHPQNWTVENYIIKYATEGTELTEATWSAATTLAVVSASDRSAYSAHFDQRSHLPAGETAEFGVRAVYENGALSSLGTVVAHRITAAFAIEGQVKDDQGNPMSGVVVRMIEPAGIPAGSDIAVEQTTDAAGNFLPLGPVSDELGIVLQTETNDENSAPGVVDAYFDYRTPPYLAENTTGPVAIGLIAKREFEWDHGNFGVYVLVLQSMTSSSWVEYQYTLRKWEHYPVSVYIPEGMSTDGLTDIAALARDALAYFNTIVERPVFVEETDRDQAQIKISYEELDGRYGTTIFDGGRDEAFGRNFPQSVLLKVEPGLNGIFTNVLRHELGHCLGHWGHLSTTPPGYSLMAAGSGGAGEAQDDDILLFKSIVNLPNGTYMGGYEMSLPDYTNW